ncbi:hypothetical protein DNTS_029318 [Danionella cerebrum]|uniref:C2H2-type domain-containing protein n=1 Tax=Danionella cerebrum TaxID=2873325 RepID=A0A553R2H9_9TELE|nr:hypothetical protein DNTS_029318 [Danionella translucida]
MTSGGRSADVCKSKPGNLESVLQKTSSDPNNREIQNSNSGTETVQDEMPSGEFDDVAILPSCDQKPQHCKKSENAIYSQSEFPLPENPQAVQPSLLLRADDSVKLTLKKAMQNRKRGRKAHNVSYKQPNGPCFKSFKDKDSTNAVDLLVATDDSDVSKSEVTNLMLSLANQEIRLNEEVFNSSSSTTETRLPPQETSQSEPVIKQEQPHDRFEAIEGKALPNDGINLKAVSKKKPKKRRKLVKNVVTLSKKAFSQTPVLLSVEDRTSFSPDIVVEECPSAAAVRDVLASLETSNSKKLQKSTTKKRQQTKEHTLSQIKGDPSEDVPTTSSDPDFKQHQKARYSTDLSKEYPTKTKGSEQILGNLRLKKRRKRRKRVFTRNYPGKDMSFTETTGFSDGARNLTKIGTVRAKHEEVGKKPLTCKYCGISFRHITAYSIHQRIHTGVKPFQCKVCGKTFSQLSQLKSHLNVHKPGTSFPCPCCSQQFLRKEHLLSHFKVHLQESNEPIKRTKNTVKVREKPSSLSSSYSNIYGDMTTVSKHNQEPLSCKDCEKRFLTPANLKAHERTHWPVKPYACSICGKGFNQLKNLRKHSQGHSGQMPFSCLHCGHASSDLSGLRLHQASKSCLARLGEKVSDNVEGFIINQGVDGQVNTSIFFKCQICKQRFSKWCQYTLHLQTHASSPSNICVSCGQCYEKDSDSIHCALCCQISGQDKICGASLSEIMQGVIETYPLNTSSETLPSSVIPQNPQSHTSSELLSKPMAVKTTQSQVQLPNIQLPTQASASRSLELFEIPSSLWKFRCLRCGQRFKQQKSLSLHMQRHPPGFRYTCAHCGQFFDRWSKLWLHQRRHRFKSKYFPCEECNLQFRFLSSFKEHMIGHQTTDACSLAPETFTQVESTNALRSESNAFKKSLKCDVCSKTFSNLNTLITHSLLHNGSTSHFCLSCNLSFANSRVLNEHLKTHSTNFTQALPDIPLKPLDFPYKCKRCNAGFSTGDLLYAHQIRHSQDADTHVRPAALPTSNTSTEVSASTQRNPVSLIKLDGIPNDASLYVYPHPDKLYVPTHVRCPVINLDSDEQQDVSDRLEPSTHLDITHVPQPETTDPSTSKTIPTVQTGEKDLSSKDQTSSTVVDHMETNTNAQTGESFECADCCQKLSSVLNLYEHYILHALGDNYVQAH